MTKKAKVETARKAYTDAHDAHMSLKKEAQGLALIL